jgi:3-oxoacyl-[acyl-carrier-protein] synthase-1
VGWDKESAHRLSDAGSDEKALLGLLADAPPSAQSAALPLIVGTLNGDPVRAMEWGTALVSLPPWASGADHLYPAASFGDTGAAAGAMNVVFALRTLTRSRAGYPSALVWASGDDGGRAVVWLQPTNGRGSAS